MRSGVLEPSGVIEVVLAGDAVEEIDAAPAAAQRRLVPEVGSHRQIDARPFADSSAILAREQQLDALVHREAPPHRLEHRQVHRCAHVDQHPCSGEQPSDGVVEAAKARDERGAPQRPVCAKAKALA
jgi:hypothetical protein